MTRSLSPRAALARRVAIGVAAASRRLGTGSGSVAGGRAALLLDPELLGRLGQGREIALVSGTNGKTTTTRLLAEAVGATRPVATSRAGSNMTAGLVAALCAASDDATGVLEVDEAHLPVAIASLEPAVVVLLNLSRDQLDRVSEVRMLAERWRAALATTDAVVVANADDPLVVHASSAAASVLYVGTATAWHEDAHHCPRCDRTIEYGDDAPDGAGWACACGFARPPLDAALVDGALLREDHDPLPVTLALPGRFNGANAALAALAAGALGVDVAQALEAIGQVDEVEGRFGTTDVAGRDARLLLAKNPAGFTELLDLVAADESPLVVGINARVADGHDPSWLWDVPFERLAGRLVTATGERAADLAVRLDHAGVNVQLVHDQPSAIVHAPPGVVEYLGNYTAFQSLRRAPTAGGTHPVPLRRRPVPSPGPSALRIVVVHPDLLGTYGDGGNARVLANRAAWRGIDAEVVVAGSDTPLPRDGDIYLLGGGEDGPQVTSATLLRGGALVDAAGRGAVVLAVCAGFQILGVTFPGSDGRHVDGVGLLDVVTDRGAPRAVGEILVDPAEGGDVLTGFENHAGRSTRGDGLAPLGTVTAGIGNGDGTDGAVSGRVFGTYLHGPLLARNPAFCDRLLALATGTAPAPLDDEAEALLRSERIAAASGRRRRSR